MSKTDSSSIKMNGDKVRATLELETTMTAGEGVKRKTLAEMLSEGLCSCEKGFGSRMSCVKSVSYTVSFSGVSYASIVDTADRGARRDWGKNTVQLEKNGVLGTRGQGSTV